MKSIKLASRFFLKIFLHLSGKNELYITSYLNITQIINKLIYICMNFFFFKKIIMYSIQSDVSGSCFALFCWWLVVYPLFGGLVILFIFNWSGLSIFFFIYFFFKKTSTQVHWRNWCIPISMTKLSGLNDSHLSFNKCFHMDHVIHWSI